MSNIALLKPALVLMLLPFVLMFWMARERFAAVRSGEVKRGPPGTRPQWVGRSAAVSNAFHNQLEMPMVFYALVVFATLSGAVDTVMIALAWVYVALRLVHAFIHTTYNIIMHRFLVFAVSNIVLIVMWLKLLAHVFGAGAAGA